MMRGADSVFKDCEIGKVWDENGSLFVHGYHHDGGVDVELRQLTDAGEEALDAIEDAWVGEEFTIAGKTYDGSAQSTMGNRAVITSVKKDLGVYVHWNGGPDSIGAFLDYCSLRGFRPPESDTYGYARLCQVLGNYFGADGLSVGIDIYTTDEQMDPGDNGIYVIEGWAIVERIGGYDYGSDGYDHDEMLRDIDKSQPEDQQLGAYLDADVVPVSDLSVGDRVYMRNTRGNMVEHTVVGFGSEGSIVNGHHMDDVPYVDKYDHDGDYSWNSNNYLMGETVRRSYEAAAADGLDLDSEGRAAREVSAGLGDRADRQPDFAGRDL